MKYKGGEKIRFSQNCIYCKKRFKEKEGYDTVVLYDGVSFGQIGEGFYFEGSGPHCENERINGLQWEIDRKIMQLGNQRSQFYVSENNRNSALKEWVEERFKKKDLPKLKYD